MVKKQRRIYKKIEIKDYRDGVIFKPRCLYCGKVLNDTYYADSPLKARSMIDDGLFVCSDKCLGKFLQYKYPAYFVKCRNELGYTNYEKIGRRFLELMEKNEGIGYYYAISSE